jgi:hypothetical protein
VARSSVTFIRGNYPSSLVSYKTARLISTLKVSNHRSVSVSYGPPPSFHCSLFIRTLHTYFFPIESASAISLELAFCNIPTAAPSRKLIRPKIFAA